MQFDELCALVGALRDRVADLEAEVAALKARNATTQIVTTGVERWRVDAVSSKRICDAAAQGVRAGITVAVRNRLG